MGRTRGRHVAPRSRFRRWIPAVGLLAVACVASIILLTGPAPFSSADAAPEQSPSAPSFDKEWTVGPEKVVVAVAEPVYNTVGSPLSMDDPYEGFVPVQCPDGMIAGSIDANGNQSDCRPSEPAPEG